MSEEEDLNRSIITLFDSLEGIKDNPIIINWPFARKLIDAHIAQKDCINKYHQLGYSKDAILIELQKLNSEIF